MTVYVDRFGNPKGPWSPWGRADEVTPVARGVAWLVTPSHGGLRVSRKLAEKVLTPIAIGYAERWAGRHTNYVYFEEDVACVLAFFEHPEWHAALVGERGFLPETREGLEKTIANYVPEYATALANATAALREENERKAQFCANFKKHLDELASRSFAALPRQGGIEAEGGL